MKTTHPQGKSTSAILPSQAEPSVKGSASESEPTPNCSSWRIKSILVPIDFSEASVKILEYAVPFAKQFGAKISLLHVIEPMLMPDTTNAFPLMIETSKLISGSKTQLELLVNKHMVPELVERVLVLEGRSFHVIVETARELDADIIMTATHGYKGLDRMLLGSTAERVIRHAPCPVLVIRPRQNESLKALSAMTKILVPIDFSVCSKKALTYAIALAHERNVELALIHVVEPVPYYGRGDSALFNYGICEPDYARLDAEMRAAGLEHLSKLAKDEIPAEIRTTTRVQTGSPDRAIHDLAKSISADLIVISTHGRTGLKHVFLGSVAEHVVREAPCPVLVVREREHDFI